MRTPPDILITTPESLYLMLTSRARESLRSVEYVIIDEIHAMAPTKRGAHLMLSLERLEAITRPTAAAHRALGHATPARRDRALPRRLHDRRAAPGHDRRRRLAQGARSSRSSSRSTTWPSSRRTRAPPTRRAHRPVDRTAREHLAARAPAAPRADPRAPHHARSSATRGAWRNGSPRTSTTSPARSSCARTTARSRASSGSSSSPTSRPGGCARSSRRAASSSASTWAASISSCSSSRRVRSRAACNASGAPGTRSASRARARSSRSTAATCSKRPRSCGACAKASSRRCATRATRSTCSRSRSSPRPRSTSGTSTSSTRSMRRSANFAELSDDVFREVLDMLVGPLPVGSLRGAAAARRVGPRAGPGPRARRRAAHRDRERRHDPRPRPVRRVPPRRRARRRARRGDGLREPRRRDVRARRVDVAHRGDHVRPRRRHARAGRARQDAVLAGRPSGPAARARAARSARMVRELRELPADAGRGPPARRRARRRRGDEPARATSTSRASRPGAVPDDRTIVVERFPDEIGDWRICILTPFGSRVHAPWALALEERLARADMPVQVLWSDDGIILRLPEAIEDIPLELLLFEPDEVEELVVERLPSTSLFASRFRENAAPRAAAPPPPARRAHAAVAAAPARGRPARGRVRLPVVPDAARDDARVPPRRVRPPRAARGARRHPVAQAARRPGRDQAGVAVRAVAAVRLDRGLHVRGRRAARRAAGGRARARPRPAARPARRRGAARAARPGGARRARARAATAHAEPRRRATPTTSTTCSPTSGRSTSTSCAPARRADPQPWLDELLRAAPRHRAPATRYAAAEDAARLRDALGIALPPGLPTAFTDPVDAAARRSRRALRAHARAVRRRRGRGSPRRHRRTRAATRSRASKPTGASCYGEFRPGGVEREWCDADVLRVLRRRSLAALRHEIEPVDARDVRAVPARVAGRRARPARARRARRDARTAPRRRDPGVGARTRRAARRGSRATGPTMLDELCAAGELVWVGAGPLGADDGRVRFYFRDRIRLLAPAPDRPTAGPTARSTTRCARGSRPRARRSGPTSSRRARHCADECGRAHRAVGSRVGGRGHQRHVRSAARAAARAPKRTPRGRPNLSRLTRLGPPAGAGRWSLVAPLLEPAPSADRDRARAGAATARTPRRRHARRRARRRRRRAGSPPSTRCCARSRNRAGRAAVGSSPGSAPRSSRCPARSTGSASFRTPSATNPTSSCSRRPIPAQPYGAALAWPDDRRPPGARRRRARRARRRRARGVPRARRQEPPHLRRRSTRSVWADALVEAHKEGRIGRLQLERIDDEPARTSPVAPALRDAGFADGYKGLTLRT